MTSDILTARALDEAVAKMMPGWRIPTWRKGQGWWGPDGEIIDTFQDPDVFYNIVLPWMREQGWEIHINCITGVWGVELYDGTKSDFPFIAEAGSADMIIAVLNAAVRASEATQ